MKKSAAIAQNYYPELLGRMYIINTSSLFSVVWKLIGVFLDEKTKNKIKVLGSNYLPELLKDINIENLPEFLGGNCKCEQIEGGCLFADIGPWNPEGINVFYE